MVFNPVLVATHVEKPAWYQSLGKYAQPNNRIATWQLLSTLILYFCILTLMVFTVKAGYGYGITLGLAVGAAAVFVRIFIFFHDCTHGCFVHSPHWNRNIGYICGVLTFTAFHDWRRSHAGHHISAGDLDRRGFGDITTLTVEEYLAASPWERLKYRVYRSPWIMFTIGPLYYFLLRNRWPSPGAHKQDVHSVIYTDLSIAVIMALAGWTIGFKTYVLVQLPILFIAATFGVWLFYIQHQFQGVYWARHNEWNPWRAALEGASFYQLPKMLQWLSGNIGFHHVHHARPGIPNYYLQKCYEEVPELQTVPPLTIASSLECVRFNLYDEKRREMVSFRALKGKPSP
ncbi:fatty acid desaturase [Geomesophilobacter sediminis]|uniref:Fatty acid desaturase n=1 Tax=Geomesophilobacter sediminis TaxID=2798584 RepID=A0A8J7LVJ2_9BACT|nr:fatty acid desaturase [Geomesophilobacter sediminis]MBJ6725579.1 fatty acid desaturase [Geomesophilobacter sediminis]